MRDITGRFEKVKELLPVGIWFVRIPGYFE